MAKGRKKWYNIAMKIIKEYGSYLKLIWSSRTIKAIIALALWIQPQLGAYVQQYVGADLYELITAVLLALAAYYRINAHAKL